MSENQNVESTPGQSADNGRDAGQLPEMPVPAAEGTLEENVASPVNPEEHAAEAEPPAEHAPGAEPPEEQGPVTGHDFSRAESAIEMRGALAPEFGLSGQLPVHLDPIEPPSADEPMFQSWQRPEYHHPARIPNFGHLGVLAGISLVGRFSAGLLTLAALHFHLFGISSAAKAETDIHYTLGSMAVLYLVPFVACLAIFPLVWQKSFFVGLQWNGMTALRLSGRLFGAASVCFILALANGWLMPGPDNTPIDKIFRAPGAAWLLFAFGVTFAPFFEEIVFRGFLLPSICTAADWIAEHFAAQEETPLDWNGHPQWSMLAMVLGSILTSVPFALMHAEQTGHALGPFLLLFCVSMVLCWARLSTRSLASSVLVHASYNFLLFSLMLLGTGGFKNLDKM